MRASQTSWACLHLFYLNVPALILLYKDESLLLQTFSLVSKAWNSARQILLVKTKGKKALSSSASSTSFVTTCPFSSRPVFSLVLLLLLMYL